MVAMLIGMQQHYARTPCLLHFHTGNIRLTYFHAIDKHFCQAFCQICFTLYICYRSLEPLALLLHLPITPSPSITPRRLTPSSPKPLTHPCIGNFCPHHDMYMYICNVQMRQTSENFLQSTKLLHQPVASVKEMNQVVVLRFEALMISCDMSRKQKFLQYLVNVTRR